MRLLFHTLAALSKHLRASRDTSLLYSSRMLEIGAALPNEHGCWPK